MKNSNKITYKYFSTSIFSLFLALFFINVNVTFSQETNNIDISDTTQQEFKLIDSTLVHNLNNGFSIAKIKTSAECDTCKEAIEKAVNRLDGVKESNLEVSSKIFTVKFENDEIDIKKIKFIINREGYDADNTKANPKAYNRLPECCKVNGMEKK